MNANARAWVGEELHTMRRTAGGGMLLTIVEGERRGERALAHANGNMTLLPAKRFFWGRYARREINR